MTKGVTRPITDTDDQVSGILVLTPAESKRLIAKAVVAMPQVKRALEKGRVIIATEMTERTFSSGMLDVYTRYQVPLGRLGQPEEVTGLVVFLASAEARYTPARCTPLTAVSPCSSLPSTRELPTL